MLKKTPIKCYATKVTKAKASEAGKNPDETFEALLPDLTGDQDELIADFCQAYSFTPKKFFAKCLKHLKDTKRAQAKAQREGKISAKAILERVLQLSTEDLIKYQELVTLGKADEANALLDL